MAIKRNGRRRSMVSVGFICEGDTERIIIESGSFKLLLASINLQFIKAINATGNGNLLPKNIIEFTRILSEYGTEKIIILTDLDKDACIISTKRRVDSDSDYITVVAVKSIEAWFLADSITLSSILKEKFTYEFPEEAPQPRDVLNQLFLKKTGRGIGPSKPVFAQKMINHGFSVENAAAHNNCRSATYFFNKLKSLA